MEPDLLSVSLFFSWNAYFLFQVSSLSDPCPYPDKTVKGRSLNEKVSSKVCVPCLISFFQERVIYAPFSGIGGIVYDKDAVYIDTGGAQNFAKGVSLFSLPSLRLCGYYSHVKERRICAEEARRLHRCSGEDEEWSGREAGEIPGDASAQFCSHRRDCQYSHSSMMLRSTPSCAQSNQLRLQDPWSSDSEGESEEEEEMSESEMVQEDDEDEEGEGMEYGSAPVLVLFNFTGSPSHDYTRRRHGLPHPERGANRQDESEEGGGAGEEAPFFLCPPPVILT